MNDQALTRLKTAGFTEFKDAEKVLLSLAGNTDGVLHPDFPGRIANVDGDDWIQIIFIENGEYGLVMPQALKGIWVFTESYSTNTLRLVNPTDLADWLVGFSPDDFVGTAIPVAVNTTPTGDQS
jgi:hypothetical protein